MKKKILISAFAAMAGYCGFPGPVWSGGCFLEGRWLPNEFVNLPVKYGASQISVGTYFQYVQTACPTSGYRVAGWYYKNTGNVSEDEAGEDITSWTQFDASNYSIGTDGSSTNKIPQTTDFTAQTAKNWVVVNLAYVKYAIEFIGNGGSETPSSISDLCVTNSVTLPTLGAPTGYDFKNWKAANGKEFAAGTSLTPAVDLGIAHVNTNFMLTAQWTPHTMSITYDLAGGSHGESHADSATYGEVFKVSAPTKSGHKFVGWSVSGYDADTARYGTDSSSVNSELEQDGKYPSDGGDVWFLNLRADNSVAVKLTANWLDVPNEYYVRFNPNGGIGTAFVWTNLYGTATNYPAANTFAPRSEYWSFFRWSNTVDGTVSEAGAAFSNLTAEANATVDINAVWSTTLSDLALAMHCNNLTWENYNITGNTAYWLAEWGPTLGYESSGSCVSQNSQALRALQASVTTNGTFTFYCKMASGNAGTLRIWVDQTPDSYKNANLYKEEIAVAGGSNWTKVKVVLKPGYNIYYVSIANWTNGETIYIDKMTWTPGATSAEPTEEDARNFTEMSVGGGALSLAFEPDAEFAYNLRGTNDLTAALSLWPVLLTTNGSEKISILLPVETAKPCMFYYLETISK